MVTKYAMINRLFTVWTIYASITNVRSSDEEQSFVESNLFPVSQPASSSIVYCQPLPTSPVPPDDEHVRQIPTPPATKTGKNNRIKGHNTDYTKNGYPSGQAYEKEGKYWLVPPFLIGASSIVVIYITVHCLYTHCNCDDDKQRRRRPGSMGTSVPIRRVQISSSGKMTATGSGRAARIVLSDHRTAGSSASAPGNSHLVPLVCYDDIGVASDGHGPTRNSGVESANGHSQMVETQPFLIYEQCDDSLDYDDDTPVTPRKSSGFLQLPGAIGRRLSRARLSFSSIGRGSQSSRDREPRASICFLPVSRAISDPSGVPGDSLVNGSTDNVAQARFEAFYCRSCGCHNIINVASQAQAIESKLPDDDNSPTVERSSRKSIDIVTSVSSPMLQASAVALPVPTITVEDETTMDKQAAEYFKDHVSDHVVIDANESRNQDDESTGVSCD